MCDQLYWTIWHGIRAVVPLLFFCLVHRLCSSEVGGLSMAAVGQIHSPVSCSSEPDESMEPYTTERLSRLPGGYRPLTQPFRALDIDFNNVQVSRNMPAINWLTVFTLWSPASNGHLTHLTSNRWILILYKNPLWLALFYFTNLVETLSAANLPITLFQKVHKAYRIYLHGLLLVKSLLLPATQTEMPKVIWSLEGLNQRRSLQFL